MTSASRRSESQRLFLDQLSGRLPPVPFWWTVGAVLLGFSLLHYWAKSEPLFLLSGPLLSLGVVLVPAACRLGWKELESWKEPLAHCALSDSAALGEFWRKRKVEAHRIGPSLTAGFLVVLVALPSFFFGGYFRDLDVEESLAFGFLVSCAAFNAGVGLYSIYFAAKTARLLGDFHFRVDPHQFGLLTVGSGLAKLYLIAAGIWMTIGASGSLPAANGLAPILFIGPPSLAVIVTSYLWSQLPLHRRMLEYKRDALFVLDLRQIELRNRWLEEASEDGRVQLQFVQEQMAQLNQLPDWPFGRKSIVGVLASALGPMAAPVLQTLLEKTAQVIGKQAP